MIPRDYIGPAVLANSTYDAEVTVTGWAGEADGEQYFTDGDGSFLAGQFLYLTADDAEDARKWNTLREHLHRGGEYGYWWMLPGKFTHWWPTKAPSLIPTGPVNVYFGVHPAKAKKGPNERARIDDVSAINCLFAELDVKDYGGDKDAVLAHLATLAVEPSVVVDSGGGFHCYWLLTNPFELDTPEHLERAKHAQAAWVVYAGGDPGAKDLARVLRVPGTANLKYAPARKVIFERANFARLYKLADLEVLAQPKTQSAPNVNHTSGVVNGNYWLEKALAQAAPGRRNSTGFWLACQLRDNGVNDLEARNVMHEYAQRVTQNGSAYTELEAMASLQEAYSGAQREPARGGKWNPGAVFTVLPPTTGQDSSAFDLYDWRPEDGGIMDLWLARYGYGWRFVTGLERWIYWTGTHWSPDETRRQQDLTQRMMDGMNQLAKDKIHQAKSKDAEKIAAAYVAATKRAKSRVGSVEEMAKAHCAIAPSDLNASNTLNLANGTLDLDTGKLRPHDANDLLTYCLPYAYDPAADSPRWRRFIHEVLVAEDCQPDHVLALLYQELFGYSLTRDTSHEKMVWQAGNGGNGKTVAINVLEGLLGGLGRKVDFNALGTNGNYDLADLPGKRAIFSSENERGGKLVEGLIRNIVSGEIINTRAIYGKPFEFKSTAKIWWSMNDKPTIRDTSNATWRRLVLIPFNRTFTDQDKDPSLTVTLTGELPGILNWALEGLARLRANKRFTAVAAVSAAVEEYKRESNPVAQWMGEQTIKLPQPTTVALVLYQDYSDWCEINGRNTLNSTNFGTELKRLGVERLHTMYGNKYALGLLKKDDDS